MQIAQAVISSVVVIPGSWRADWAWGLPLIVLTVVIHVLGLGLIAERAVSLSNRMVTRRHSTVVFVTVVGATTLFATCLHALEAGIWASAYSLLGALPDERSAMLYSLSAITSYGHETLQLKDRWQLMGSLEALNGWLLFGLSTAFLFGMIEKVWTLGNKVGRR
jgi:MFS superfamily sulfate permease-like transporter